MLGKLNGLVRLKQPLGKGTGVLGGSRLMEAVILVECRRDQEHEDRGV